MEFNCPNCARPVVSRKNVLCTFCGARLPKELLFTDEERMKVEADLEELRQRRQPPLGPNQSDPGGPDPLSSTDGSFGAD